MTKRPPDPDSLRYARYWEPVLAGPARRMLERISDEPRDYLDVGAGTGSLMLAAAARWPEAHIVGLDASAGMLSVARHHVATELPSADAERFTWLAADVRSMPLPDASVDVATSSFVLQLVADRPAVLAEIRRVLRPGAVFGLVAWIADELVIEADDAFVEVLEQQGLDAWSGSFRPSRTTDYKMLDEARDELTAAGFDAIDVRADELQHAWTREAYLEFKEHYDDRDAFEALDEVGRGRLREAVRARWAELPDTAFTVSGPLVSAIARRP